MQLALVICQYVWSAVNDVQGATNVHGKNRYRQYTHAELTELYIKYLCIYCLLHKDKIIYKGKSTGKKIESTSWNIRLYYTEQGKYR